MSDPLAFTSTSARFGLPFLFSGQAQKEAFVNEAHAITDALLHCAIECEASIPPTAPTDGTCWLVAAAPTGDWQGQAGKIACRQAGNWLFVPPRDGLRVLNRQSGQEIRFAGTWLSAARPADPGGGTTIDAEARSAIVNLINALATAGILPAV